MKETPVTLVGFVNGDTPAGSAWLGASERAALSGLRFTRRRASWRLGRWTAKVAVIRAVGGLLPEDVEVVAAADGAPEAHVDGRALPLRLSISHSGGVAFSVVAPVGAGVGCDVEAVEPRAAAFVSDYFGQDEAAWVSEHRGLERPVAETLVWSAKESALKLLREGMRRDTREIRVAPVGDLAGHDWSMVPVTSLADSRRLFAWWRRREGRIYTVVSDVPGRLDVTSNRAPESEKGGPGASLFAAYNRGLSTAS